MATLIVTASSKSKAEMTDFSYDFAEETFYNSLNSDHQQQLIEARKELVDDLGLEMGPDILSEELTEASDYLPGYIRFAGRTYSRITNKAWNNLIEQPDEFDCVILSAPYGITRYNEPIRMYEFQQKDNLSSGRRIMTYWKYQGAKDWLYDYIKTKGFDDVKFVLSTSYSKIIQRDDLIEELNNEDINAEDKQFKAAGRSSMLKRGDYINNLLLGETE